MSRGLTIQTRDRLCFPRVSGDEPMVSDGKVSLEEFSPRERG